MHVESDDSTVRIDIADSGVGIAPEALNRIFDMFTGVGRDSKRSHPGLGVGLNLARRLVEMHNGQLVASSEGLGKGSHFLITLPLVEVTKLESTATEKERTGDGAPNPVRALIVDDNIDGDDVEPPVAIGRPHHGACARWRRTDRHREGVLHTQSGRGWVIGNRSVIHVRHRAFSLIDECQ